MRMAETRQQDPVLLIVAAFSRHLSLLSQAGEKLQEDFGPVAMASRPYAFTQTTYYESAMGPGLKKLFLVFADLVAPDCLPEAKLLTNKLEHELARCGAFAEARPINLDPGLLTLGKFTLATTKDQAHRIYLSSGIFAEISFQLWLKSWSIASPRTCATANAPNRRAMMHVLVLTWIRRNVNMLRVRCPSYGAVTFTL